MVLCPSKEPSQELVVIFGGSSVEKDYSDFLVIETSHLINDKNFSEINEIF